MSIKYVYPAIVKVTDEVFTESMVKKWRNHILNSYVFIFRIMKAKIDPISSVKFFFNDALAEEAIADAVIGMRKVVDGVHSVKNPNAFKVAAYLAYWWLRHKPVSIHYPKNNFLLENVQIVDGDYEDKENEQRKIVWRLKHINEVIAVHMVTSYIFKFDKVVCKDHECRRIKKASANFCFDDFSEMQEALLQKLTYYFAYRPITPKVIEHILEGYTFHPAWELTGRFWPHNETVCIG
jgi:hypothetical protein